MKYRYVRIYTWNTSKDNKIYIYDISIEILEFNWQVDLEEKSIKTQISFTNQKERLRSPNGRPVEGNNFLLGSFKTYS